MLLFFDAPGIRAAVGNGSLASARVELTLSSIENNWGSEKLVGIHRLEQPSAEYQATWSCALDANVHNQRTDCSGASAWSMSSKDPALQPWLSPPTATAPITKGQTGKVSFDVTTDVAALLAGSSAGHGWLLKKVDDNASGSLHFASRELGPGPRLLLEIDGAPGGGAPGAVTGSARLPANADTHIRHAQPRNFGSDEALRIQASGRNRALVGFDAQALRAALAGRLVRARLDVTIASTFVNWGSDGAIGAHRLLQAWGEHTATWDCAVDSDSNAGTADCSGESAWNMWGPGVDFPWIDPPTGTALVSSGQLGQLSFDVTRDVACALAGHAPAYGWLLKKSIESQSGKLELRSRETTNGPSLLLEWTDGPGVVVSAADCGASAPPGGCTPTAAQDVTCNGLDEDCDGIADDDFSVAATSCGVGACAAAGETSCVGGQVVDSCAAGAPALADGTCDGQDDDCNGAADEDYVSVSTSCGIGSCVATGTTSCVAAQVVDSCTPGAPGATDASCNGIDEDCSGTADEDFVSKPTMCSMGACQATGTSNCVEGKLGCTPGELLPIDDGNPCTSDVCDPAVGPTYVPKPQGTGCADQNVCDGSEACNSAGVCVPGAPLAVNDGNACTTDSCEASTGVQHTVVPAGTSCDDGNVCNGIATCNAAALCQAGTPLVLDDGNPCTTDVCDPSTGVEHAPTAGGSPCPDSDLCNGAEACNGAGSCVAGTAPDPDDGNPCTIDGCDPATGVFHLPSAEVVCDDGNLCNGVSVCDSTGTCIAGQAPVIDDGNPCTLDLCDQAFGVINELRPVGFSCDDGDLCNGTETCSTLASCVAGTPPIADDQSPCTDDGCSPATGVFHVAVSQGTPCASDNLCLGSGACDTAGSCLLQAPVIDDGNACTSDSCDPVLGVVHTALTIPDDGNPCTLDLCDPALGVMHPPAPENTSCADGDLCNGDEVCGSEGTCVSVPASGRDDENPCTEAVCDGETGQVSHVAVPDGSACLFAEICGQAGECLAGECLIRSTTLIDDANTCTADVCDASSGEVQHFMEAPGTACDNGNACDGLVDTCDAAGECIGTQGLELPTLGEPCQIAECDPTLGIVVLPAPRGTACGLRMVCDDEGACVPGASVECELECSLIEHTCGEDENDYEPCLVQCALATTGLCAAQKRDYQECLFEHAEECLPRACNLEDIALFQCQSSACGGAPVEHQDCSLYSCTDNVLDVQQAPDGTPCESLYGCGVGSCVHGSCQPGWSDRCVAREGPGVCAGRGNGDCVVTVPLPSPPCYDAEFQAQREPGTPCHLGPCSEEGVCDRFGRCQAEPRPGGSDCDDGDVCNGLAVCGEDESAFECLVDDEPIEGLDDDDPCTEDACDAVTGEVSHAVVTSGASCEDSNQCDGTEEVCDDSGECVATIPPEELDDGNPCTLDFCFPSSGGFHAQAPDGTSCRDDDPCNGDETCSSGECQPGEPFPLENDNPCVVQTCDPELGLVEQPAPAGTICEVSEDLCFENSRCDGVRSCVPGQQIPIDDGNPCTVDACTPDNGVEHVYMLPEDDDPCTVADCDVTQGPVQLPASAGTSCPDGDACNGDEVCDGSGACVAGIAPLVDDSNPCTSDGCDDSEGVYHEPARGGTSCSDGNACNGEEICSGAGQCLAGVPLRIDDGRQCTTDSCDPASGSIHTWIEDEQCQAPTWATLASSAPSPRDSAASAFIPATSELFVFGGENAGVALSDSWLFELGARRWRTSYASPPSPRAGAVAVYDELNERVLVFGGISGSAPTSRYFDEVWEYEPASDVWTELEVSGPSPTARAYAASSYDSTRDRVVLFGGVGPEGDLGDTWELDPLSGVWALRTSTGPSARSGAAMAYDLSRNRMVLVGGAPRSSGVPGAPLADVWELDGATGAWSQRLTTNSPPARTGHTLVYDDTRQKVRLLGGAGEQPAALGDLWDYDGHAAIWQRLSPANAPARAGHFYGYDPETGTTLMAFGLGYSASGVVTPAFSDVWQLDASASTWREVTARVAPVSMWPGLVFDHQRALLVSLGHLPATNREAVWELDERAGGWQQRDLLAQSEELLGAKRFTTLAYDSDRRRTVAIDDRDIMWEWDGAQLMRGCDKPPMHWGSTSVYDPIRKRLMFVGGFDFALQDYAEHWELDLASCAASRRPGMPKPRRGSMSVWDGQRGRVIVHSGGNRSGNLRDTWEWDGVSGVWKELPTGQVRPPVANPDSAVMVYDPVAARVLWYGGLPSLAAQTWQLDSVTGLWTQLPVAPGPKGLKASAAFDAARGNVVILDADANIWDFAGSSWQLRELSVVPPARSGASGGWVAQSGYGVLFGGMSGDGHRNFLADTWIWKNGWKLASSGGNNPSPGRHRPAQALSPPARAGHALGAGFEGSAPEHAALLFGGENDSGLLGDTWTFNRATFEWTGSASDAVSPRTEHAVAPVPGVGYVLFGGLDRAGPRGDTHVFTFGHDSQQGWTADRAAGSVVSARWGHAMALDAQSGRVLLFGGRNGEKIFGDTWEYNPSGVPRWTEYQPRVVPPARFGHELSYDPERQMIILTGGSGANPGETLGDTWQWNGAENLWERRLPERSLPARAGHVAFFDANRGELVSFGGLEYADAGRAASTLGDTLAFENASATIDEGARFSLGSSCTEPSQCESGLCVDGFCCNAACTGQCAACDSPGEEGRCVAVQGTPHGSRPACVGSDPCAACGGVVLDACGLAEGATCGPSSCQAGVMYESGTCYSGVCTDSNDENCEPYNCNADGCRTRCGTDKDCFSSDYFCRVDYLLGYCRKFAVLLEVRPPYTDVHVGQTATVLAWVVEPPAQFRFSYLNGAGQRVFACGSQFANSSECRFAPTQAGTFQFRVEARATGSSKAFDDAREFELTVLP